jgi:hypothetical protein
MIDRHIRREMKTGTAVIKIISDFQQSGIWMVSRQNRVDIRFNLLII